MNAREFAVWASELGVPVTATEEIIRYAASPEEMKSAFDAMGPAPPIYTLADIVAMTDTDPYGISPRANGFVIVGGCPNGDPIAIDVAHEPGTVWYIGHEKMHGSPVREASVRVTGSLKELFRGMAEGDVPFDYYEARDRAAHPDR